MPEFMLEEVMYLTEYLNHEVLDYIKMYTIYYNLTL